MGGVIFMSAFPKSSRHLSRQDMTNLSGSQISGICRDLSSTNVFQKTRHLSKRLSRQSRPGQPRFRFVCLLLSMCLKSACRGRKAIDLGLVLQEHSCRGLPPHYQYRSATAGSNGQRLLRGYNCCCCCWAAVEPRFERAMHT